MNKDFTLFTGIEKFYLILKKLEEDNKEIFEEADINYNECCSFGAPNNHTNSLLKVNDKLPVSMKTIIENKWKEFCESNKI